MPPLPDSPELRATLAGVWRAVRMCVRLQGTVGSEAKGDGSPVTIADIAGQGLIGRELAAAFPDDAVLAEERYPAEEPLAAAVRRELATALERESVSVDEARAWIEHGSGRPLAGRHWTVDPIDGTKGFIHNRTFAVAVGLVEDGRATLGVIAVPGHGPTGVTVYFAVGGAAYQQTAEGDDCAPLATSPLTDPARARAVGSRSAAHGDLPTRERIYAELGVPDEPFTFDGMGKYAMVAAGDAEVYLRIPHPGDPDREECAWDHVPGVALVEAAGGRVTDALGRPFDLGGARLAGTQGILATNGPLHEPALAAVRRCWSPAAD